MEEKIRYWINRIVEIRNRIAKNDPDSYEYVPLEPPASDSEIREVEKQLGAPLPEEYKQLLKVCNGWQGCIGFLVDLYGTKDLLDCQEPIQEHKNGLVQYDSQERDYENSLIIGLHKDNYGDLILLIPEPGGTQWIWTDLGHTDYIVESNVIDFLKAVYRYYEEQEELDNEYGCLDDESFKNFVQALEVPDIRTIQDVRRYSREAIMKLEPGEALDRMIAIVIYEKEIVDSLDQPLEDHHWYGHKAYKQWLIQRKDPYGEKYPEENAKRHLPVFSEIPGVFQLKRDLIRMGWEIEIKETKKETDKRFPPRTIYHFTVKSPGGIEVELNGFEEFGEGLVKTVLLAALKIMIP